MMTKPKPSVFTFQINGNSGIINLNIIDCFDISYKESKDSPIDSFFLKGKELSKLLEAPHSEVLANLILLGYMSSVENYLRHIIRKIILVDEKAFKSCELIDISFGAAFGHSKNNFMPEILLERTSFANQKNILEALNQYIGIDIKVFPPNVKKILDQYSIICELRHCIIHRSGKLGSKNAIKLGLKDHANYIEKPIIVSDSLLNDIIDVCHNTVKEINNYLYQEIMMRIISDRHNNKGLDNYKAKLNTVWTWVYKKDAKKFKEYFDIFISQISPPPNNSVKDAYVAYKSVYDGLPKGE